MKIQLAYYSAQGNREINEDSVSILEFGNSVIAIVADGLGGHGGGDVASRTAIAAVNSDLQNQPISEAALHQAIQHANQAVCALQKDGAAMKTTISVLWIGKQTAIAANVGDSRIYQFRGDKIVYQSVDHSVAQMAVLVGEIQPDQIRQYPKRSQLVRSLGMREDIQVDSSILQMQRGDRFLLCTDGFWENIAESEMCCYAARPNEPKVFLRQMRNYVETNAVHNMDNHSAIAVNLV